LRPSHPHLRILEHRHQALDGVRAGAGIAAFQHADVLPRRAQKSVHRRWLAQPLLLDDEAEARVAALVLFDDGDGAVGAARGHNDDLRDGHAA
jgi:hypothetical protein